MKKRKKFFSQNQELWFKENQDKTFTHEWKIIENKIIILRIMIRAVEKGREQRKPKSEKNCPFRLTATLLYSSFRFRHSNGKMAHADEWAFSQVKVTNDSMDQSGPYFWEKPRSTLIWCHSFCPPHPNHHWYASLADA